MRARIRAWSACALIVWLAFRGIVFVTCMFVHMCMYVLVCAAQAQTSVLVCKTSFGWRVLLQRVSPYWPDYLFIYLSVYLLSWILTWTLTVLM